MEQPLRGLLSWINIQTAAARVVRDRVRVHHICYIVSGCFRFEGFSVYDKLSVVDDATHFYRKGCRFGSVVISSPFTTSRRTQTGAISHVLTWGSLCSSRCSYFLLPLYRRGKSESILVLFHRGGCNSDLRDVESIFLNASSF